MNDKMDNTEENVQTLLNMGFPVESEIRHALRIAKNDLSEAVAILTNDTPVGNYDALDDLDVEMKDVGSGSILSSGDPGALVPYGPSLPPSYEQAVELESPEEVEAEATDEQMGENSLEFPFANLVELENRVFTDSWSIPYKKDESLGVCLVAATRLADENLIDSDQNCKRFIEKCMPEAFQKLLTSGAVRRWGPDIQEGIYSMLQLLVDLVTAALQHDAVPVNLMHVLAQAFNPETEYHIKNKNRRPDKVTWENKFGIGQSYAISPTPSYSKDPFGWLTNLINRFADKKGFEFVKDRLAGENLDPTVSVELTFMSISALMLPFGNCAEFLNPKVVQPLLAPGMETASHFVQNLTETDLKDKRVGTVCDMLATMKLLCIFMWTSEIRHVDELRLNICLRMLQSPHFNAKMNSLKELTKLIRDASGLCKTAIESDSIRDWLLENKVLSIALEGNIDQVQYCDKIKNIVDFLGASLSQEELAKIWKMQKGENNVVIDNIHSIIAVAGVKFDSQLDFLVGLIKQSWQEENHQVHEKLLSLIGKIGKETKSKSRILELLWDLSHLPSLPTSLMEQALEEHLAILLDNDGTIKEHVKRTYVSKCINDIKEGTWVLPALKQLLQIAKNIAQYNSNKAEKGIFQELNKNFDIIKQVTNSLSKFHQVAVSQAKGSLGPDTLVDGRYTHKDYMSVHLEFLQFILQKGVLYLSWHRARDLWDKLIANPDACEWDKETCFEWFTKGISDLEAETQSQLFQRELLKLDANKISQKGFSCFKHFFETVNLYENKLKRPNMIVEKLDLIGLDFLWELCLRTTNEDIAESAVNLLMTVSYTNLAARLKRDPMALHKKFIDECYSRMEEATLPLGGSILAQVLSSTTTLVTAATVPEAASLPSPSRSANLLSIERLLLIAERYVVTVEELHTSPRTILPHGASFRGQPITITAICDSPKKDINLTAHTNETIGSIRQKIATHLGMNLDQIQIVANDKLLNPGKDQKLLHQLEFQSYQVLTVRTFSTTVASTSSHGSTSSVVKEIQEGLGLDEDTSAGSASKQSFDLEQEKMLPGVIMAGGGQVFDMLYRLSDLEEPKITKRVRHLLELVPTDPFVNDALDSIGQWGHRQMSLDDSSPRVSPKASPRVSPRNSPKKTQGSPLLSGHNSLGRGKPKEVLKALFDCAATDMTCFRILYNLEVLSSKLVPTTMDAGARHSAQRFREDFLSAGGLNLVVNILQREAIPGDVDYEIRQGCYSITLQLLRFLLCDHVSVDDLSASPASGHLTSASLAATPIKVPPNPAAGAAAAFNLSSSPSQTIIEPLPMSDTKAVQTLTVNAFTDMVSCFLRVAWAAAAGKLTLASSAQPIKESHSVYSTGGGRSRQSSTGSTTSTGSEGETCLHAGVCVKQTTVSPTDAHIAKEALELLVTSMELQTQLLSSFYSQPCMSDFVIDILVGSPQEDVRVAAVEQFYRLSKVEVMLGEGGHQATPHQFLLQTLLKARLPFWVTSSNARSSGLRLLKQCTQYFDLRCRLVKNLTVTEQKQLQVDILSMLGDELGWLNNFVPCEHPDARSTDNIVLAAHLRLIRTLLTCEGVNKQDAGSGLVQELLHDFLFPASKLIMEDTTRADPESLTIAPKCSNLDSRQAAFDVLCELADGCHHNLRMICDGLVSMHHGPSPDNSHQWEYMPPVDGRSKAGFVGLKNGGATCYMNSVIQQLYMTPGIVESMLGVDDEDLEEESVFAEMQNVLGHLLESKLQYYVPEKFWKVFRLWGQTINIREQQDAFDFYQAIIDQIDEQLKKVSKDPVFKKKFQGVFSDQKICQDCPHRYEREEVFFALNVTVKNATLQDSLAQYVKGELLEGDNAYFCEKCGEKRNTMKRMCIKTLPPMLCIQLKRFGYDWEANRALKFDDHFKFPWVLDMEPYTAEGMARVEASMQSVQEAGGSQTSSQTPPVMEESPLEEDDSSSMRITVPNLNQINYELVGVVVHSGQANAGHYYSFIKDRRGTYLSNPGHGKWFKFNDNTIEEFDMNDATIEAECFGGSYKAKVYDQSTTSYPEERLRYWNGYLLFYERIEDRTPMSAKKSRISLKRTSIHDKQARSSSTRSRDSLVELTELVHKGEKKGLFTDKMPARIQQVVRDENLRFMKNRGVYDADYFSFLIKLTRSNVRVIPGQPGQREAVLLCLKLIVNFLFNTYFRTKTKLRSEMGQWVELLKGLLEQNKEACQWLVEFFSADEGNVNIKPFLLECQTKEIRCAFGSILECLMTSYLNHGGLGTHTGFDRLVESLLQMLPKDVPDHVKMCTQYFSVLHAYSSMGTKACSHMFGRNAFSRLVKFLLGTTAGSSSDSESSCRRWSSIQSRDFGPLYESLATLVLNCDASPYRTETPGKYPIRTPTVVPQVYLKMSSEMHKVIFGGEAQRFIKELVVAMREVSGTLVQVVDMFVYCSFCNATFSIMLLKHIMVQYATAPANELKNILTLLHQVLVLEDPLQMKRLQCIIDGYIDEGDTNYEGMLTVIKLNHVQESRRSYQCIKFLVSLAQRCPMAKDYLIQTPTKWQWAVNWLKKKMTNEWQSQPSTMSGSNEDSNSRSFQRTMSAQDTLEEATALLVESQDLSDMETNGDSSEKEDSDKKCMFSVEPIDVCSSQTEKSTEVISRI